MEGSARQVRSLSNRPTTDALAEQPRPRGSRKLAGSEQSYRLRVGAYRVLYQVNDAENWSTSLPWRTAERRTAVGAEGGAKNLFG